VLTNKQKIGAGGRKMWERISVPTTDWNDRTKVEEWRKSWADICNEHLNGRAYIDHRSYARQGKKQLPTIHEGYVARKIAKSGKHSNIISYNQQVRQHNALEQANEQDIQTAENELKQLENELEKIKSEQKGQEQDGFSSIRRDFAKLLERGKRTIDGVHGSSDNSKREQRRDNQTAESGNQQPETTTQRTGTTDTDAIIKCAKAVSDSARATIANSTASRADREAEQQRQAVQGSSNNEKRSREDNESNRRTDESRPKTRPRR
ncbi:MAG: MobA/MobL family protein, partial [Alphaproteobacteria bacterium]|nr:MobA/MobL family protein [Alphaproteobacteria bacterium]